MRLRPAVSLLFEAWKEAHFATFRTSRTAHRRLQDMGYHATCAFRCHLDLDEYDAMARAVSLWLRYLHVGFLPVSQWHRASCIWRPPWHHVLYATKFGCSAILHTCICARIFAANLLGGIPISCFGNCV